MKYLRTQTTIYEVEGENEKVYLVKAKKDENNIYSKSKINTFVVAVSDKLEDLCDEFVIIRERFKPITLINLEQVRLNRGRYGFTNSKVYGAIWTDKGLIYVAEMNSEGELKLL